MNMRRKNERAEFLGSLLC